MDQGSNKNHSPVNNFAPTVTKFCVMWEGQALPHDTKFGNCRGRIVDSRMFPSWSLIHGLSWSSLIKAEPGCYEKFGPKGCEIWFYIIFCFILSFLSWPARHIIVNKIDITCHVTASQFLQWVCDVISEQLWRYQQNVNRASEVRSRCVKTIFSHHLSTHYIL